MEQALELLRQGGFSGLCLFEDSIPHLCEASLLPRSGGILSQLDDGVAVLDLSLRVVWCNRRFEELAGTAVCPAGRGFFDVFPPNGPLDPDPSPFHTSAASGICAQSRMKLGEKTYLQVHATPVTSAGQTEPTYFAVLVRDITRETLLQEKLNAIFEAGLELGDMSTEDLRELSFEERIEVLKAQIVDFTQRLLQYETVEIRLLDPVSRELTPLLNVGMLPEAANRVLKALPQDNGVTGFVAYSGQSYLCTDPKNDPLYLKGAAGACSSLTVPLKWHDRILGTFNVESTRAGAFSSQDLQFLELFGREVAVALNKLNLLAAEKISTATESTERMLCEVAQPVDDVLNDAAWIIEKYIGHDPSVVQRLQAILKAARSIKQSILRTGEELAPREGSAALPSASAQRHRLRGKRILVVDNEDEIRQKARALLVPHGCEVESAHNGEEALRKVRNFQYDAVLADIRLPDMNGYDCFRLIKETQPTATVVLMTGFGYDAGHSIVKARQQGMKSVLYKPFREEMLLDEVEKAATHYGAVIVNQGEAAGTTAADPKPAGPAGS
ncbi:MAG: response regulator [Planctomycetaceae bacterium]|nr:MAG: response regulator [Planctomycetaceae bacterium]